MKVLARRTCEKGRAFEGRNRVRHLCSTLYQQKGTWKNITVCKSLEMMRKQYHVCELEIMKLVLSLCIPSIKYGKENYLKDDTIPHVVIKMEDGIRNGLFCANISKFEMA